MGLMMKVVLVSAGLMVSASPVLAAPVYLTCDFTVDGKPYPLSISADEQTGRVAFMSIGGGFETFQAAFVSNGVVFGNRDYTYIINRTTLEAVRAAPVINEVKRTKCSIDAAPTGRAF